MTTSNHWATLKRDFDNICDRYALAFCNMYGCDPAYGWWVSDERGGVYCANDLEFSLCLEDLTYCVNNQVPEKDFMEWWNYVCDVDAPLQSMSLRQWMNLKRLET